MLVCPSRIEPLGNVVIEAWAHRRPVIATAADGPAFLITHGETGLLTGIDDADGLARAITQLIQEPQAAQQLAVNGHDAYLAKYTEAAVVQTYMDFLARVSG